jgi:phosphatidylglycerol:prolipoprotein diacylglycerol transferase
MDPVAFHIGSYPVYWYGIIITTGAVLGAWLASWLAQQRGQNPDHVWNMLIIVLILGIIGARLYHVFSRPAVGIGWDYYKEHPMDIFIPRNGGFAGLGIYGGFIGGIIGVLGYTWYKKLNFFQWADFAAPGLLLAQSVGRWGNFVNQELFGPPTTLPWGIKIDCVNRQFYEQYNCNILGPDTRFHPTFLYESIWNFAGVVLMVLAFKKFGDKLRTGDLLFFYLIYYPLGRFFIELFFRPDAWTLGSLPTASVISLISMTIGVLGLLYNHFIRKTSTSADVRTRSHTPRKHGKSKKGRKRKK